MDHYIKRIATAMFAMLIGIAVCWAGTFSPQEGKLYKLKNTSANCYFKFINENSAQFQDEADQFMISPVNGGYTLQPMTGNQAGKYLNKGANGWDVKASETALTWVISETETPSNYYIKEGSNYLGNTGNAKKGQGVFRGTSATDCVWILEEADFSIDILGVWIPQCETLLANKVIGQPTDDKNGTFAGIVADTKAKYNAGTATFQDVKNLALAKTSFLSGTNLYLPDGYYYMTNLATDARMKNIFNAFQLSQNPNDYTLQSGSRMAGNNGIWKIVNNGDNVSIKNGQGQTLKTDKGNFSVLHFVAYNGKNGFAFTEYPNAVRDKNAITVGSETFRYLTTWSDGGANAMDNRWSFEAVANPNIYEVEISGYQNGYVIYNTNQYAKNGGFFNVSGTLSENSLTAWKDEKHQALISIDEANKKIKVKYQIISDVSFVIMDEQGNQVFAETLKDKIVGTNVTSTYQVPLYAELDHSLTTTVTEAAKTIYARISLVDTLPFVLSKNFNEAVWYDMDGNTDVPYAYTGTPWNGIKRLTYSAGAEQEPVAVILSEIKDKTYSLHDFAAPYTITYIIKYKGAEWFRETRTVNTRGDYYPAPTAPYGISVSAPEGTVDMSRTLELECSINGNLGFEFYNSYAEIKKWYTLQMTNNKTWLNYQPGASYMTLASAADTENPDKNKFAFVGNPYQGFTIYNKAAGQDYVLSSPTPGNLPSGKSATTGQYAWPVMKAAGSIPEGDKVLWDVAKGSQSGSVLFARHGEKVYCNSRNDSGNGANVFAFWTGGADVGSCIYPTPASDNPKEYVSITDGKYYRIQHVPKGSFMTENYLNGNKIMVSNNPENRYCQIWKAEMSGDKYALKNVLTGKYVQNQTGYSAEYETGKSPYYFSFKKTSSAESSPYYIEGSRRMHSNNGDAIVGWYGDIDNNAWNLYEVELTTAELNLALAIYQDYSEHHDAYQALKDKEMDFTNTLRKYFNDYACTDLKPECKAMTEEDFLAALAADNLPEVLIQMALKVKNNAWEQYVDGYEHLNEKFFRVHDYQVYSDESTWAGLLGGSNARGRWSNPTGVVIPKGENVYVYVDQDVPAGSILQLNGIRGTDTGVRSWTLHKGLNIIQPTENDRLYIYYKMNNLDAGGNIQYLKDFPNIKIHIEGGWVNGYWDGTRQMTNEDWKAMIAHDKLLTYPYMDIKSDLICMLYNTQKTIAACPQKIREVTQVWDHMVREEFRVMGVYYDANGFTSRFNNLMNAFSVTYNYMYASSWGGWYNESTLGTIMNADVMQNGGGALWGPAHEMGHNNQGAINMVGCTEISNNLFSNVVVWQWGKTTTRGSVPATTFNNYRNGKCWYEGGIWERTRMYYQLWQYFFVCKHDVNFYPKLFRALLKSPLRKSGGNFCPADLDILHFAEVVCEVAQMDLTDFFEVYGFFKKPALQSMTINGVTKDVFVVGDYSTYYVTFEDWETKVAATKAKLAKYANKAGANLMFIEDRIEKTVSDETTANPGWQRSDFSGDVAVGRCGDVGSFTQFTEEEQDKADADNYYFVAKGSNVTLNGKGAVGFKIYDDNDKLIMLSNNSSFTATEDIVTKLNNDTYRLYVAQSDGKSIYLDFATSEQRRKAVEDKYKEEVGKRIADGSCLKVIQCKKGGAFARYDAANTGTGNCVLSSNTTVALNSFFHLIPGNGSNAGYYTIRLASDPTKFVYALNKNSASNNVCVKQTEDNLPTDDCYWQLVAYKDGYNIKPKGGSCGWNRTGGGANIGQWSSNATDDNTWYVLDYDKAWGFGDEIGLYPKSASEDKLNVFRQNVTQDNFNAVNNSLTEINVPETGKYYRLKNAVSGKYMTAGESGIGLGTDGNAAGTIFYLDDDNSLQAVTTGLYLDCKSKGASNTKYQGKWYVASGGAKKNTLCYKNNTCFTYGGGNALDRGSAENSSTLNHAGYNWIIENVNYQLTIGDAGYATLCLPYNATIPQGLTAYWASEYQEEDKIVMTQFDGNILPANEGFVIAGTPATYVLEPTTENVLGLSNNKLVGVTKATNLSNLTGGTPYILNYDAERNPLVQFNKATGTLGAYKSYLWILVNLTISSGSVTIEWKGGSTTGIEEPTTTPQPSSSYNLLGQKVHRTQKGIQIINGKKVYKK